MKAKEKLIEKIQNIEDESILQDLLDVVDLELNLSHDVIELSNEQKAAIDEGLKDLDEGRTVSHEQARKIIDEWMRNR